MCKIKYLGVSASGFSGELRHPEQCRLGAKTIGVCPPKPVNTVAAVFSTVPPMLRVGAGANQSFTFVTAYAIGTDGNTANAAAAATKKKARPPTLRLLLRRLRYQEGSSG